MEGLPKYPKLMPKEKCAFPERDNCNYDEKQPRCQYMKYDNSCSPFSSERWKCRYLQNTINVKEK